MSLDYVVHVKSVGMRDGALDFEDGLQDSTCFLGILPKLCLFLKFGQYKKRRQTFLKANIKKPSVFISSN